MEREIRYEIKQHIATLSESNGYALEVNLISWNGADPKIDIRRWDKVRDRMQKGVTLTKDEAAALTEALKEME